MEIVGTEDRDRLSEKDLKVTKERITQNLLHQAISTEAVKQEMIVEQEIDQIALHPKTNIPHSESKMVTRKKTKIMLLTKRL